MLNNPINMTLCDANAVDLSFSLFHMQNNEMALRVWIIFLSSFAGATSKVSLHLK